MSWFESITKEMFQSMVREAVKEELTAVSKQVIEVKDGLTTVGTQVIAVKDELKRDIMSLAQAIQILGKEIELIKQRLIKLEEIVGKLEYQVDRLRESNTHFADRIGRLEVTLEGSLRGITADLKLDLYEKFRGELPAKASKAKSVARQRTRKSFAG